MKVKLTRMETLDACDFLSTINLKGADEGLSRRIILAQVLLDAEARKIRAEDELISTRLIATDEEKEACKALAKVQAYQKAKARVEPVETAIDKARSELEKKYNPKFDIEPFTMEELVAHYANIGVDFNLQTFDPIKKLIKG